MTTRTTTWPIHLDVYIQEQDLKEGVRYSANHCPLALAVAQALSVLGYKPMSVIVGERVVSMALGRALYSHQQGPWVRAFDRGKPMSVPQHVRLTLVEARCEP